MNSLILLVENLKNSNIRNIIDSRMKEFEEMGKKSNSELFKELCFCLMTANFSATGGIKIQNAVGEGFHTLSEEQLARQLAVLGHRFPNMRAKFIVEARTHKNKIKEILSSFQTDIERRKWFAENVKGLGMKESSHFLRNVGHKNVAIIDFHIIDLMARHGVIEKPKNKSLTSKRYLEIENILNELAEKINTSLGYLDLYLWYDETGKILK